MEFGQSEEPGKDQFEDEDRDGQFDRESEEENEEEEDDDEQNNLQVNNIKTANYMNTTNNSSSGSSRHQQQQLHHHLSPSSSSSSAAAKKWPDQAVLMDYLSLKTTTTNDVDDGEREHMFDKVVTPSDVGKLNRLVIPKQHAEKYFPLDTASTEKGLLLNFEDRGGKSWRFRYSYWNSSQSYVMTKGWSRFVKDKKLDAGDIVSFHRSPRDPLRLFIDWRRRPHHHHFFLHNNNNNNLIIPGPYHYHHHHHNRWPGGGGMTYTPMHPPPPPHHEASLHYIPAHHHHQYQHQYRQNNPYPRGEYMMYQVPSAAAPKRLRLFGVNMEYGSPSQEDNRDRDRDDRLLLHHQQQQVRLLPNNNTISSAVFPIVPTTTSSSSGFVIPPNKGKSSAESLSFDLDP